MTEDAIKVVNFIVQHNSLMQGRPGSLKCIVYVVSHNYLYSTNFSGLPLQCDGQNLVQATLPHVIREGSVVLG